MVKVILIAMLSLLAVVHAAGWALLPATTDHERATLTSDVAVGGGFAVQDFKPPFPAYTHDRALTPAFASLLSVNRLDYSIERPLGGQWALALAEREAGASWHAAGDLSPAPGHTSEWRWDRVAVLNTAASTVSRPRRPQWSHARGRKLWPQRRPSRGAQVWLTRKQP